MTEERKLNNLNIQLNKSDKTVEINYKDDVLNISIERKFDDLKKAKNHYVSIHKDLEQDLLSLGYRNYALNRGGERF